VPSSEPGLFKRRLPTQRLSVVVNLRVAVVHSAIKGMPQLLAQVRPLPRVSCPSIVVLATIHLSVEPLLLTLQIPRRSQRAHRAVDSVAIVGKGLRALADSVKVVEQVRAIVMRREQGPDKVKHLWATTAGKQPEGGLVRARERLAAARMPSLVVSVPEQTRLVQPNPWQIKPPCKSR
jgi:hypothetical protein